MNSYDIYPNPDEKPLDKLVEGYSHTSIFRRIAFIGDSLSSGEFETKDADGTHHYHDIFEYSWGQFIARNNGITAYNFSRGGMTAKTYLESFADKMGYFDPALAAHAYVIALGVNDLCNRGMPLGEMSDVHPEDYRKNNFESFLGNYAAIISRYKEISPDAKFFLLTMPRDHREKNRAIKAEMQQAMFRLADLFEGVYVIDLHTYAPIYDERFKEEYFLLGHLSPAGYLFTAKMVDSYIDYIVRHNPQDFKNVGFIGTGIEYK